jgi:hypothetical protein
VALGHLAHGELEAVLLRGKALLAMEEFGPAQALLEEALVRRPDCLPLLLTLSHVLLREDRDRAAAERVLLAILALEPSHTQSRQNLDVLRRRARSA